jgi:hypothetical protein
MAMVTRMRAISCLIVLLAGLTVACAAIPGQAQAQGKFDFFLTAKAGRQTAEGTGDNIVEDFEAVHGDLVEDREVKTEGIEFDLVTFPRRSAGVGLGLEYYQYYKVFHFRDPAGLKPPGQMNIKGRAFLYTLKFYGRLGPLWPFLGVGSGIYVANFGENGEATFFEGSTEVLHGRLGARLLLGKWSILLEYGRTHAPLFIQTRPNMPELELGGIYSAVGIGRSF